MIAVAVGMGKAYKGKDSSVEQLGCRAHLASHGRVL